MGALVDRVGVGAILGRRWSAVLWDLQTREIVWRLDCGFNHCAALSPNADLILPAAKYRCIPRGLRRRSCACGMSKRGRKLPGFRGTLIGSTGSPFRRMADRPCPESLTRPCAFGTWP